MSFTSLKNKLVFPVGTIVNQVYTDVAYSAVQAVHKAIPTTSTKIYDILETLLDPYDCLDSDYSCSVVKELMIKHIPLAYISNSKFSSIENAKDAMKFDLANAMTTTMPGIFQDPRNIYGIMSPYQQEKIDRKDYEFVEYFQGFNKALFDQHARQTNTALKMKKKKNHKQILNKLFRLSKK
ncbi:hypothetical protein INT46_003364 [Mucor plumbeus]|uniref:Uncharacterized protein n=1 Tax=Mucor plumbeus TaxID=97098 RepID=A0A8H7UWZ2_9FUNG|nr:hypothetical protein INT46_003364 [Mucor plumbeus]